MSISIVLLTTQTSEICTSSINQLSYIVVLEESTAGLIMGQRMLNAASCKSRICTEVFPVTNLAGDYQVTITASNGIGQPSSRTVNGEFHY